MASAVTFVAQALDPTPSDPGTAIVQSVGRLGSAAAHAAQEGKAALGRAWSTQRRAFWKAEAAAEGAAAKWGESNVELMQRGRAAQYTDDAGNLVPYELHHTPTGQSAGGTKVRIVTREEHAAADPNRHLKQNP